MTEQDQQHAPAGDAVAPGAVPPPRGPIPDLGFFAGAPQPGAGTFGGSSQFGGPPAPPSQFGGPPTPAPFSTAPAPFGSPPAPFGTAPAPLPPPRAAAGGSWSGTRLVRRIGVPLAILVVLGAFGVGRFSGIAGFFAGDMTVPETMHGLPQSTDPDAVSFMDQLESELEDRNSGDAVVAIYGAVTPNDPWLFFAGQRTRVDIDRELADGGVSSTTREIGDNTCGTAQDGLSVCVRTSSSTSVVVGGNVPVEQVSAALDEAWDAQ